MKQRIPQLDGVRGIAILVVMIHNSAGMLPSLPYLGPRRFGWMGVDLFFVLSGFLITGILLDTRGSSGYFLNFYVRRCLRIWPLYYALLFLMFVAIPLLRPSMGADIIARSKPWWSYLIFYQDFLVRYPTNAVGPLAVTWSLAIEEQFYLVWAVVVRYCSAAQLRWLAILVILFSPGLRYMLLLRRTDVYSNVFCRLDGLMAGGLVAQAVRFKTFVPSRYIRTAVLLLITALPLACLTDYLNEKWITYSLSAAASTAFVYLALFASPRWFQNCLRNRALTYTGMISYGLYLLHKLPFDAEQAFHLNAWPLFALLMGFVVSYVAATASWFLLERPILKLKRRFEFLPTSADEVGGRLAIVDS